MKSDILGFNQEKILKYNLSLEDLLLLDYVWDMIASPTMQHIVDNGIPYVWLMHDRILADLPILNISNRSLINYLNKLKSLGLLDVKTIHSETLRGSKSYYAITEKCEALRYDQVQNFAVSQRPSAKNCCSDIRETNNTNNTNTQINIFNNKDKEVLEVRKSERVQWFVDKYNEICKSLPKCQRLNPKRSKAITRILKNYTEEEILTAFNNLENSDFCKGKNDSGWKADIDFLLKEDKFDRVLEGRYNDKKRGCKAEAISEGEKFRVSAEEKEEMRKAVERGELKEY